MTKAQKIRVRLIALAVGAAALLVPVTLTPGEAVEANEACADNVCCKEIGSVCEQDSTFHLNYYEASECRPKKIY